MVRFKVVKGSHLLLAIAVLVLVLVLTFLFVQVQSAQHAGSVTAANTVMEARAQAAFASTSHVPLQIQILPDEAQPVAAEDQKRILIYHTHTHEAYRQDSNDPYEAVESWRTYDEEHSVVRLGMMLAEELRLLGYDVTHDTTDHEQDSLSDSYVRSLATLESYAEEFDLCIDLHRDAYSEGLKTHISDADGKEYAQLMLLVGRGDNYPEVQRPDYEANLAFAQTLTGKLNAAMEDLCRNVTVKQGRYNQHIGTYNILVEVGHNQNTLQQAMASIPLLSKGIHETVSALL